MQNITHSTEPTNRRNHVDLTQLHTFILSTEYTQQTIVKIHQSVSVYDDDDEEK